MLSSHGVYPRPARAPLMLALLLGMLVLSACGNLRDQPKLKTYDASPTFGTAARNLEPGTVPVGYLRADEALYQGTQGGEPVTNFPIELTEDVLREGRRQYEGFCAPCHGYGGYGDGVIALEGYPQPAPVSYHDERLRQAPNGYFFQVITNGKGQMFSYASRISPENRWAIVAYIRALQISQNASIPAQPAATTNN